MYINVQVSIESQFLSLLIQTWRLEFYYEGLAWKRVRMTSHLKKTILTFIISYYVQLVKSVSMILSIHIQVEYGKGLDRTNKKLFSGVGVRVLKGDPYGFITNSYPD